jgi:translation initiation factor IF-1
MKNHWLNKFRTGRLVRYKGVDADLSGKVGHVVRLYQGDWVDVQFEFDQHTKIISVEKDNLEII